MCAEGGETGGGYRLGGSSETTAPLRNQREARAAILASRADVVAPTIQRAWIRCINDTAYKLGHDRVMTMFADA